jgi:UDP-N-acetyl-D-mannosaminuronate dehydrogenase
MNVTIVGSGHVGLVTEACFAQVGHHATRVDNNEQKVADADFGLVKELMHSPIIRRPQPASTTKCSSKWASTTTESVASP